MPCIRHSKNKRTKAINIREMLKWGDLHASAHANGVPCECTTEAAAFKQKVQRIGVVREKNCI